jgi:predicted double-glycine peptidase
MLNNVLKRGVRHALVVALLFVSGCSVAWAQAEHNSGGAIVRDPEFRFQQGVASWRKLKQQNVVMQKQDYSCGAAALATVVRYYWGDEVNEEYFLRLILMTLSPAELQDRIKNGLTMTDLRLAAVKGGYQSTIGKLTFEKLTNSKVPLVVGITFRGYDHFVVFRGWDGYYVYLADPIRGNIRLPAWEFVEQWQKNAVLVVAKPGADVRETSPLSVSDCEKYMGETTRDTIRRNALRPPSIYHGFQQR